MKKGNLLNNYIYNLLYQIFVLIVSLITAPYLSRHLGAESLGMFSYISSFSSIITSLTLVGIYSYGTREIAYVRDDSSKTNETFWELMILRFIFMLIGIVIYAIVCAKSNYAEYFIIYFLFFLSSYIDTSWLFVGEEDMKPTAIKNFVIKLINVVGIFIFIKTKNDLNIYILMISVATFFSTIVLFTQLKKYVNKPNYSLSRLKIHLTGSLHLFLPQIATLFYIQIDKILLNWFTKNPEQLAFYDQADKIIGIPLTFITVISTVIMPRIANEYKNNDFSSISKMINYIGKISLLFAMPMMCGVFSISTHLIPWYLGNEFVPTATAMMVLCPIIVGNTLSGISGNQYFTATDQVNILLKSYISTAVMNIVVDILLIPKMGFVGSAIATVMACFTCVAIQYYYLQKEVNIKGLIKPGVKYLLFSIIMLLIVRLSYNDFLATPATTLYQIVTGLAVYMILLIISKDEFIFKGFNYLKEKILKM